MVDPARRAKLLRELEQDFVPDYDALKMPSGDKRAAVTRSSTSPSGSAASSKASPE